MRTPTQHLIEKSVKVTAQRAAVLEFLQGNRDHPSPDEVYRKVRKRFPYISRATVYNTIKTLVKAGMLQEVRVGQQAIRVDPNVTRHHHFTCRRCGRVEDLPYRLLTADQAAGRIAGYDIERVHVVVQGVCPACRAPSGRSKKKHKEDPS